jgi:seryl-tRNA synthetase
MWRLDDIRATLTERGDLWEVAPGLIGLRGPTAALYRDLERAIADLVLAETDDAWQVPPAIDLASLERAEYFASFPQWLTLAAHLSDDPAVLKEVAEHRHPAEAATTATAPAGAALTPAVCYHVYRGLAGTTVKSPTLVTAQSHCWRHEGGRHAALERGWAFTMRELVCVGTDEEVREFLERSVARVRELAAALDLPSSLIEATDPFFAPTARGKALLQRVKGLKRELTMPIAEDRDLAVSSFNLHETFFGDAFDIRLADGRPATTGCLAFGIERWVLAFLVRHGTFVITSEARDPLLEANGNRLVLNPLTGPNAATDPVSSIGLQQQIPRRFAARDDTRRGKAGVP